MMKLIVALVLISVTISLAAPVEDWNDGREYEDYEYKSQPLSSTTEWESSSYTWPSTEDWELVTDWITDGPDGESGEEQDQDQDGVEYPLNR
ncbi:hypothetical protein HDE_11089 [Halotydeus destructor]|nr:hypothetical protein HDE_11089 [Halotydeus destructor]